MYIIAAYVIRPSSSTVLICLPASSLGQTQYTVRHFLIISKPILWPFLCLQTFFKCRHRTCSHAVNFSPPQACGPAFEREKSRGRGWRKRNPCGTCCPIYDRPLAMPSPSSTQPIGLSRFVPASTPFLSLPTRALSLAHPIHRSRCGTAVVEYSSPGIPPAICCSLPSENAPPLMWRCSVLPLLWLHD